MKNLKVTKALVEVNVLKVGNRQVTQAFMKQVETLDLMMFDHYFGLVDPRFKNNEMIKVIGYVRYLPSCWYEDLRTSLTNFTSFWEIVTGQKIMNADSVALDMDLVSLLYIDSTDNKNKLMKTYIPMQWAEGYGFEHLFISI